MRELSLATPAALTAGIEPVERAQLLEAFADDVVSALGEAEEQARHMLTALSGLAPWAFASAGAGARRAAASEHAGNWRQRLTESAALAHELSRLYSAAAPLVDVLGAADSVTA